MTQQGSPALPPLHQLPRGKLIGWVVLVAVLAAVAYSANFAYSGTPDRDILYRWSTFVGALVQYGIILAIVLFIARGISRPTLGVVQPASWWRAAGLVVGALVAIWVVGGILGQFLDAGDEQGLVPKSWDASRATPFIANFVVIAVVAPIVEELTFRGLGFAVVRDAAGTGWAVVVTAIAFGMAHGLVVALPVLATFGVILALVRWRSDSVYPGMIVHGLFNATALLIAVTM